VLNRLAEKNLRAELVKLDWLDCVIGVAKNLFFNSPMEACVLIARRDKPASHKGKVLFVEAKKLVERKNTESYLLPEHIERIVKAYRAFTDIEGLSAVATNEEIAAKNNSFAVNKYVKKIHDGVESVDLSGLAHTWADGAEAGIGMIKTLSGLM